MALFRVYLKKKLWVYLSALWFNLACSLTDLDYDLTDRTVTDKKEDNNEDKALESDGIEGEIVKEKTEESAKASTNGETAEANSEDVKAPTSDTVKDATVKAPASNGKVDDEKLDGVKAQASDKDGETKEDDKTETSDEDAETKEDKKTEASGEGDLKTNADDVEGKEGMETDKEDSATAKTGLDRYCSDSNLLVSFSVSSSY